MKLELLYFDDCPNWKIAAERLDGIATRRGLSVQRRLVTTPEEAEAAQFRVRPRSWSTGRTPSPRGASRSGWPAACTRPPTARPDRSRPSSSRRPSMRDRNLAPFALVGAIVCCGATALIAGLVGGVALAATGQFTAVSPVGLGVVVLIAWALDRRRHRHDPRGDPHDRSAQLEGTQR